MRKHPCPWQSQKSNLLNSSITIQRGLQLHPLCCSRFPSYHLSFQVNWLRLHLWLCQNTSQSSLTRTTTHQAVQSSALSRANPLQQFLMLHMTQTVESQVSQDLPQTSTKEMLPRIVSGLPKDLDNNANARNVAFQLVKEGVPESTAGTHARIVGRWSVMGATVNIQKRHARLVGNFTTRI